MKAQESSDITDQQSTLWELFFGFISEPYVVSSLILLSNVGFYWHSHHVRKKEREQKAVQERIDILCKHLSDYQHAAVEFWRKPSNELKHDGKMLIAIFRVALLEASRCSEVLFSSCPEEYKKFHGIIHNKLTLHELDETFDEDYRAPNTDHITKIINAIGELKVLVKKQAI